MVFFIFDSNLKTTSVSNLWRIRFALFVDIRLLKRTIGLYGFKECSDLIQYKPLDNRKSRTHGNIIKQKHDTMSVWFVCEIICSLFFYCINSFKYNDF